MNQKSNKSFKQGELRVADEDITTLAQLMHTLALEESETPLEADITAKIAADTRINQELLALLGDRTETIAWTPDASCQTDEQLWSRIQAAQAKPSVPVLPTRRSPSWMKLGTAILASAAAVLFFVRPWNETDMGQRNKGTTIGQGTLAEQGCSLALKLQGETLALTEGAVLPASTPVLLQARCPQPAYLHIVMESAGERLSFGNISVQDVNQWVDLENAQHAPVGLQLPGSGSLQLIYGLSQEPMADERWHELESGAPLTADHGWLWTNHQTFAVTPRSNP